ncbi:MAG TPA: hypothetical protein VFY50_00705 [Candidatus Nitrosocosmicus sp.]|nr:hypothetical protein [Candidatus Nitrosocosmicus sp.]
MSDCYGNDIEEADLDYISAAAPEVGIIRDTDLTVMIAIVLPIVIYIPEDSMSHAIEGSTVS